MSTPKHPQETHASQQAAQEQHDLEDAPPPPPPMGKAHAPEALRDELRGGHGKADAVKPPGRSPSHSVTVGGGFKLCFNTETETFCVLEGTREVPLASVVVSEKK